MCSSVLMVRYEWGLLIKKVLFMLHQCVNFVEQLKNRSYEIRPTFTLF